MIIKASSTRSQGLRCIIPISPSRIPQTSLARRADHPLPPGCRRRENPGPRAHRGCRERDAAQLLLRLLGARCCHHPWLHRIRAEFVVGACLMAEIISTDRKLSECMGPRGVRVVFCLPIALARCFSAAFDASRVVLREGVTPSLTLLSVV